MGMPAKTTSGSGTTGSNGRDIMLQPYGKARDTTVPTTLITSLQLAVKPSSSVTVSVTV